MLRVGAIVMEPARSIGDGSGEPRPRMGSCARHWLADSQVAEGRATSHPEVAGSSTAGARKPLAHGGLLVGARSSRPETTSYRLGGEDVERGPPRHGGPPGHPHVLGHRHPLVPVVVRGLPCGEPRGIETVATKACGCRPFHSELARTWRRCLRVLYRSHNVPAVNGNTHGPRESKCRSRINSISHLGSVIVRMLTQDLVCGWSISLSRRHPDDRSRSRSSLRRRLIRGQSTSTVSTRSYFRASCEPTRNAPHPVQRLLGQRDLRPGWLLADRRQLAHRVRLDPVMSDRQP